MIQKLFLIVLVAVLFFGCKQSKKEYKVVLRDMESPELTANPKDDRWKGLNSETGFSLPWNDEKVPFTSFKAFHNNEYFYFIFETEDSDIQVKENWTNENDILPEDRVEIFMSVDDKMETYYGLEMDPEARVLDYSGTFYRKTDHDWTCEGLEMKTKYTDSGYVLEGRIPIKVLRDLRVLKDNNEAMMGLYRGEFSMENEERTTRWITWVDPQTKKPDFHVPESFGKFIFE